MANQNQNSLFALNAKEQVASFQLLALLAVSIIAGWSVYSGRYGPLRDTDVAPHATGKFCFRIPFRDASAAELAELPGVGEKMAGELIRYREERIRQGRPVAGSGELSEIPGMGPATIGRIAPYLDF